MAESSEIRSPKRAADRFANSPQRERWKKLVEPAVRGEIDAKDDPGLQALLRSTTKKRGRPKLDKSRESKEQLFAGKFTLEGYRTAIAESRTYAQVVEKLDISKATLSRLRRQFQEQGIEIPELGSALKGGKRE